MQNGESYVVNDGTGEPYPVHRPPTKYSLAAAKLIQQLAQQLQNNQVYLQQMQRERDEALNELNQLKQNVDVKV